MAEYGCPIKVLKYNLRNDKNLFSLYLSYSLCRSVFDQNVQKMVNFKLLLLWITGFQFDALYTHWSPKHPLLFYLCVHRVFKKLNLTYFQKFLKQLAIKYSESRIFFQTLWDMKHPFCGNRRSLWPSGYWTSGRFLPLQNKNFGCD